VSIHLYADDAPGIDTHQGVAVLGDYARHVNRLVLHRASMVSWHEHAESCKLSITVEDAFKRIA
jgi:hypothetical protein